MTLSTKVSLRQLRIRDVPDDGNDKRNRFEVLIEGGKAFLLYVRCLRVAGVRREI